MTKKFLDNKTNAAISSMNVGEHVEEEARYFADWMNRHLKKGTSPSQFNEFYKKIADEGEFLKGSLLRKKGNNLLENIEVLSFEGPFPDDFYQKAVEQKADKFITFNNNAYIDIVAIRGHPTGKDIATLVLGKENIGKWSDEDTIEYIGKRYLKQK